MKEKIKCCKNCVPPKRHLGCHNECTEYIQEKEQREKENEIIAKKRKEYNNLYRPRKR